MNIPEYVIITIQTAPTAVLGDFRIPSGMTVGKLTELLVQECGTALNEPTLWLNGYMIPSDLTLAQAGIWDGSILTVREGAI